MAKLIRINPDESRDVLLDTPGVGVSARKKHAETLQEFFAVRVIKDAKPKDQTEYYVELNRAEAQSVSDDLTTFLKERP